MALWPQKEAQGRFRVQRQPAWKAAQSQLTESPDAGCLCDGHNGRLSDVGGTWRWEGDDLGKV